MDNADGVREYSESVCQVSGHGVRLSSSGLSVGEDGVVVPS